MIKQEDYIYVESLIKFCPQRFDGTEPKAGIVFCEPERAAELFKFTNYPYVVVSCASDAGLFYQADAPVNRDIDWYLDLFRMLKELPPNAPYQYVRMPPRCFLDKCNHTHKYSIKYATFTDSTFDVIPANIVKWYITNLMINDDSRLHCLPFGVGKDTTQCYYKPLLEKTKLLYVNFQASSNIIRQRLRDYYKSKPWVTYVEDALPYNEYAKQLSEHKFVLSPPGNGIDCYRNWECIYSGSIPIVLANNWYKHMRLLPILATDNLFNLTEEYLNRAWEELITKYVCTTEPAKLSYWKEAIAYAADRYCK